MKKVLRNEYGLEDESGNGLGTALPPGAVPLPVDIEDESPLFEIDVRRRPNEPDVVSPPRPIWKGEAVKHIAVSSAPRSEFKDIPLVTPEEIEITASLAMKTYQDLMLQKEDMKMRKAAADSFFEMVGLKGEGGDGKKKGSSSSSSTTNNLVLQGASLKRDSPLGKLLEQMGGRE